MIQNKRQESLERIDKGRRKRRGPIARFFRRMWRRRLLYLLILIVIALVASAVFYFSTREKPIESRPITDRVIISSIEELGYPVEMEDVIELLRVEDPESLRKDSTFFRPVEEGDYILVTRQSIIIYSLRNNSIKAIKKAGE